LAEPQRIAITEMTIVNDGSTEQGTSLDSPWTEGGPNRARWRQDGILHVVLGDETHVQGATFGERDGLEALELVGNLVGESDGVLNMTDISRLKKTTPQVLRLPTHPSTGRMALVIASPVSRMLGNAFLGITKLQHATRMFTDEDAAVAWLLVGIDGNS